MTRTWRAWLVSIVGLIALIVLWLTREAVVECHRDYCTIRNRWTGKLTLRSLELPDLEYTAPPPARVVLPPDTDRVLERLIIRDSQPGVNPYVRFRR